MKTMQLDALVLAGGESRRMGQPKAFLPLGDTTLLGVVVARLRPLFRQVLVVAREKKGLCGIDAQVLTDDRPERGPLVGLARGLAASDAPWCFVVGCDMPLLRPQVICRMAERLEGCDILALHLEGRFQPLHAFYARQCLPHIGELLDSGTTSLQALFPRCRIRMMAAADFLDIDPDLLSFRDIDTTEDYQAAQRLLQEFSRWEVVR